MKECVYLPQTKNMVLIELASIVVEWTKDQKLSLACQIFHLITVDKRELTRRQKIIARNSY